MARKITKQEQLEMFSAKELEEMVHSLILEDGREVPSGKKLFVDVHEGTRNSLKEQVHRILNNYHLQRELQKQGMETFEEAEDFNIDDDVEELVSPYELRDMIEEEPIQRPEKTVKKGDKQENTSSRSDESASGSLEAESAERKASDSAAGSE